MSAPPGTVKDTSTQGAVGTSSNVPGHSNPKTTSVSAIPPTISSQQQRTQSHGLIAIPEIGVSGSTPPPDDHTNSAPIIRSHSSAAAPTLNVLRKSVLHASEENVQDPNPDKDVHMTIVEARHQEGGQALNHDAPVEAEHEHEHEHSSGSSSSSKHDPPPTPSLANSNCNPSD